ncbi:MAG: hypothetical protein V1647_00250 [Pseudomonadota bacterium]
MRNFILVLALLLLSTHLSAGVQHYNNILIGDRGASMGGAFIGLSDDTSGTYYNPAGITQPNSGGVSGSVNVVHIQRTTYEHAIRDNDWIRSSMELMPNFFGLVKSFGRHSFGASLANPDSFVEHQDQMFENMPAVGTQEAIEQFSLNRHSNDSSYIFGPTYSYKLYEDLSIGMTLGYNYRKGRIQDDQTIWYSNNTYDNTYYSLQLSEHGIQPKLGVLWIINDKISLGFVLDRVFLFSSNYSNQIKTKARTSNDMVYSTASSKSKRNTGTHIGLGTAYRITTPLLVSFDLNMYTPPVRDVFFPSGYTFVMNWALGLEYAFRSKDTARLGFYSNKTNMPQPTSSTTLVSHVDMYGVTAGYSLNYENTSFVLGLIYSAGKGSSQIYSEISTVVNTSTYYLTGLFSANYKF